MLKQILHKRISQFEKAFGYDGTYMHEVLDASLVAFLKFSLFQIMSQHREQVPYVAWSAARLAATLSEDCGPCTQLGIDMALRAHVPADTLKALLRGDLEHVDADASLGFRYGTAVAQNSPDAVALAEEVEQRYGKRGAVSLAFAVTSVRVYPALKRGLGHGAACSKLSVASESILVKPSA